MAGNAMRRLPRLTVPKAFVAQSLSLWGPDRKAINAAGYRLSMPLVNER
jgi:hypothetical protein